MAATPIELARLHRPPPLSVHLFTQELPPSTPQDTTKDFPQSLSYDEESYAIHPPWKRSLYQLLEQPTSSSAAFITHMFLTALIIVSAFVTVLETVPAFHSISTRIWFGVETSIAVLFTVEYIARCVAWSNTWTSVFHWVFSFYGVIDLLSILPYYILMLQQDTSIYFRFSILRMFRLLRVFRPFRYNHTILLTLLYFAERGTWDELLQTFVNSDGDPTLFSSIPAAAWFVLVTITTVGYGEITPRSFLGRLITLPILVFGLLLITLPSFVLGREFSQVWADLNRDRHLEANNPDGDVSFSPLRSTRPLPSATTSNPRDLTNLKLAQNQTELSRQIGELAATVEAQGKMLHRLLELLEKERESGREKGKERDA